MCVLFLFIFQVLPDRLMAGTPDLLLVPCRLICFICEFVVYDFCHCNLQQGEIDLIL